MAPRRNSNSPPVTTSRDNSNLHTISNNRKATQLSNSSHRRPQVEAGLQLQTKG